MKHTLPKCPKCTSHLYRRGTYNVVCTTCFYELHQTEVVNYYIAHINIRDDEIETAEALIRNLKAQLEIVTAQKYDALYAYDALRDKAP